MKINKVVIISFLIVASIVIGLFVALPILKEKGNVRIKVEEIREGYKGVVVKIFSVRDTPPTHLIIEATNGIVEVSPNQEIVKKVKLGDSIIKPKNENFVYIVTPNGGRTKLFSTRLSYETRNSEYFPRD